MQSLVTEWLVPTQTEIVENSLPIEGIRMFWHGLDLRWAYTNLLPAIFQQTRCMQRAQDVLHDSLIRFALTKHPESVRQPHAYLRLVVRSVIVDTHRENSRFVPLIMDEAEFTDDMRTENAHRLEDVHLPSAEHLADLKQRLAALQIIIDSLPKKCREVFWLYGVEGHTQPEIASRLGISLNMVERHVMRALVSLRSECGQFLDQ